MASRTLFQLFMFTLSIIITKQTETRTLNETSNFAKNQKYNVNNTLVDKHITKTDVSDRHGTVPTRDIYVQERVYTSAESKHDIELRNRYINSKTEQSSNNGLKSNTRALPNEQTPLDNRKHFSNKEKYTEEYGQMNSINNDILEELALKTAIEKIKQELSETKFNLNDESLQNTAKELLTHVKPILRREHLTTRHHNKNTRTTQSMTENSLIAEVDNGIRKRPNEFKIASKRDNKLKYIDNKSRDALSLENEQYELKHVEDMAKMWVSKQINLEYTPKYKSKKKHLTDKPVQRREHLATSHHNTNSRTTQTMTETSLVAEVDNGIRKIKLIEKRNHKSPEKRDNDIYKLQRPNEYEKASKRDNKLKYIANKSHDAFSLENEQHELKHVDDTAEGWVSKQNNQKRKHHDDLLKKVKHSNKTKQNSKIKHDLETYQDIHKLAKRKDEGERILDSGDSLNPDEVDFQTLEKHDAENRKRDKGSKLKHRHNKESDTMSLENESYTLKNHRNDFQKDKVKVSKQKTKLNKPKFSQSYQKKNYDNIANKHKHIDKPKYKPEEVISNINKRNHKNKLHFITNRPTKIIREDERMSDSRDKKRNKFKVDKEDIRTVSKLVGRQAVTQSDEEATLDSSEEPFKQNKSFRLPFYISTITVATKDKDFKHAKRKIFDNITAGKMLKKLQTMRRRNLQSEQQLKTTTEVKPDKIEQIDILFEKNGEMQVVMSRENETEIEKNNSGDIETFYLE